MKQHYPKVLTKQAIKESKFLRFLDSKETSWQSNVGDLIECHGVVDDPYFGWQVILLTEKQDLFDGMHGYLSSNYSDQVCYDKEYPPNSFSTLISIGDDASQNLEYTNKQLLPFLGEPEDNSVSNTKSLIWRNNGIGNVKATVWPEELNKSRHIASHEKFPFLRTACHLTFELFYVFPETKEEHSCASTFQPLVYLTESTSWKLDFEYPSQFRQRFLRYSKKPLPHNAFGVSKDEKAFIYTLEDGYYYIYPIEFVVGAEHVINNKDRSNDLSFEVALLISNPRAYNKQFSLTVARHEGKTSPHEPLINVLESYVTVERKDHSM